MRPITPAMISGWVIVFVVAFGPPLQLPAIGLPWLPVPSIAPFKTDKLSVLIVEETEQRTTQLDSIYGAVEQSVKAVGGNFQKLDKDQTDLSKDDQWVQDAWKVKGASVPWLVAADSRRGVNQSLPTTSAADALKVLSPLGVK